MLCYMSSFYTYQHISLYSKKSIFSIIVNKDLHVKTRKGFLMQKYKNNKKTLDYTVNS